MKFEKKVVYNITLDSDEKANLVKHLTAVKTANSNGICGLVNCGGISCAECPFNDLTELESQMEDLMEKFLKAYRTLQKDNPSLPLID